MSCHKRSATIDVMSSTITFPNVVPFSASERVPVQSKSVHTTAQAHGHRRTRSSALQSTSKTQTKTLSIKPYPYASFAITVVSPDGAMEPLQGEARPRSGRAESCRGTLSTLPTAASSSMPLTPMTIEVEAVMPIEDTLTADFLAAYKPRASKAPPAPTSTRRKKGAVFYFAEDSDEEDELDRQPWAKPHASSPLATASCIRRNLALCDVKIATSSHHGQLKSPSISISASG